MRSMSMILSFLLVNTAAHAVDVCIQTAQDVEHSCDASANSDYQLALAKCDNVSNSPARTACQKDAAATQKDDLSTCLEQFDARDDACDRLGPAPYDPVINPANFVTTIDNPYFPLKPGTTFIYEGHTADGFEHSEFAVTHNTR